MATHNVKDTENGCSFLNHSKELKILSDAGPHPMKTAAGGDTLPFPQQRAWDTGLALRRTTQTVASLNSIFKKPHH